MKSSLYALLILNTFSVFAMDEQKKNVEPYVVQLPVSHIEILRNTPTTILIIGAYNAEKIPALKPFAEQILRGERIDLRGYETVLRTNNYASESWIEKEIAHFERRNQQINEANFNHQ